MNVVLMLGMMVVMVVVVHRSNHKRHHTDAPRAEQGAADPAKACQAGAKCCDESRAPETGSAEPQPHSHIPSPSE